MHSLTIPSSHNLVAGWFHTCIALWPRTEQLYASRDPSVVHRDRSHRAQLPVLSAAGASSSLGSYLHSTRFLKKHLYISDLWNQAWNPLHRLYLIRSVALSFSTFKSYYPTGNGLYFVGSKPYNNLSMHYPPFFDVEAPCNPYSSISHHESNGYV